jgi:hypothetical protein
MSEHLTPDEETITGDRPAVDDDTEGHRQLDEQPGVKAAEQPDFRTADKAGLRDQDDDTQSHMLVKDRVTGARDDEDDTEGHVRAADRALVTDDRDEDDTEGHRR